MIEASRATLTDDVLRARCKRLRCASEVPRERDGSRCCLTRSANLAKFRIVRSAREGVAILTDGPNDEVAAVEQPFVLIAVAPGAAPKPDDRDTFARRVFGTAARHQGHQDHARRTAAHRPGAGLRNRRRRKGPIRHRRHDGAMAAVRTERLFADVRDRAEDRLERACSRACARSATASSRAWRASVTCRYCRSPVRRPAPAPSGRPWRRRPARDAARARRWCSRAA